MSADENMVTVRWVPLEEIPKPSRGPSRGNYVAVDYPANGQVIYGCMECLSWEAHVDIIPSPATGEPELVIREWHREDCDILAIIRSTVCHGELGPGVYCAECGTYNADPDPVEKSGDDT